jgi:hypothetical protein
MPRRKKSEDVEQQPPEVEAADKIAETLAGKSPDRERPEDLPVVAEDAGSAEVSPVPGEVPEGEEYPPPAVPGVPPMQTPDSDAPPQGQPAGGPMASTDQDPLRVGPRQQYVRLDDAVVSDPGREPSGRWRVKLPHEQAEVVAADSPEEAVRKYMDLRGITHSDFPAQVVDADDPGLIQSGQ